MEMECRESSGEAVEKEQRTKRNMQRIRKEKGREGEERLRNPKRGKERDGLMKY